MKAFISYSTTDKVWAGKVKECLTRLGVESFLAHEDLVISDEWRETIFEELKKTYLMICLLSKDFKTSEYCPQELGFILSRKKVPIVPFSLDGTMPFGFFTHVQGQRITNEDQIEDLIVEGLLKRNFPLGFEVTVTLMQKAGNFRYAERITRRVVPFFRKLTPEQATNFGEAAQANGQIWDAKECIEDILPKFIKQCGSILPTLLCEALEYQITNHEWFPKLRKPGSKNI